MNKCPFCNKEYEIADEEKIKEISNLLALSKNNKLSCFYPHIFPSCSCGMVDVDIKPENLITIENNLPQFQEILEQNFDEIDKNKFARIAECRGYICELCDDVVGSVLSYKSALDIMEAQLKAFEDIHLANVEDKESSKKILLEADLDTYADAKIYTKTLRELVANVSARSFDKLGYLGILIHLDTIIDFSDFIVPDKMFALLNDKTTKIPEQLVDAKNQIEDRYLKIRKRNLKK